MPKRNLIARIELLSDVHIGSGAKLTRDIDWIAPGDGYVYFADSDRLLEEVFSRAEADGKDMLQIAKLLAGSTLSSLREMGWLTREDFGKEHPLFRYRLKGASATAIIREQIKDVYGRPYLPGSSLKGALRTALALMAAKERKPDLGRLGNSRTWAAQPIERQLFGRNPNYDLLRALQVADSAPISSSHLGLRQVHIYPTARRSYRGRSKGLDVDVETLARGSVLELPIHIPTELLTDRNTDFDDRRRQELAHWESGAKWLDRLARAGKLYAYDVLTDEYRFYSNRTDVPEARRFIDGLIDLFSKLEKNEFLLVLGWGGGWHTKTLNQYIKADSVAFERIVSRYRLNPTGTHKPGAPFPKSRHLVRWQSGTPGEPIGWVKVRLEEV